MCAIFGFWVERIGDSYVLSWPNTILYGCAFIAALWKWRDLKNARFPFGEQCFWLYLAFVLFVLGVNKQLNFQTLFLEVGKHIAEYGGWFEVRRSVQAYFVYSVAGIACVSVLLAVASMRAEWRRNVPALMGLAILCAYAVIRAASINHIAFLPDSFGEDGGIRTTDIIEFAGTACIFINAIIPVRKEEEDVF
jgi:hypothetical protein